MVCGIDKDINKKLVYKGKCEPNKLPDELKGDLGLIWDGNFDESDENIKFKHYTKFNNPHKLSYYTASRNSCYSMEKSRNCGFC